MKKSFNFGSSVDNELWNTTFYVPVPKGEPPLKSAFVFDPVVNFDKTSQAKINGSGRAFSTWKIDAEAVAKVLG